uniref:Peptidoglycan recognition protein family domain-containing protein n=1 Tax=Callorhinchus milii TaxID=7868 RepID=A0A4W3H182_CALMI
MSEAEGGFVLFCLSLCLCLCLRPRLCSSGPLISEARPDHHVRSVIWILEELEERAPTLTLLDTVGLVRSLSRSESLFHHLLLGQSSAPPGSLSLLSDTDRSFLWRVTEHQVTPSAELGVSLTDDGTTVSLGHVLAGIEAGLRRNRSSAWPTGTAGGPDAVDSLHAVTLTKDLGLALVGHHRNGSQALLGGEGCWDHVEKPRRFTLSPPWSSATDALINGGMDGFILGSYLSGLSPPLPPLSAVLRGYYTEGLGLRGLKASRRRQAYGELVTARGLAAQVSDAVLLYGQLGDQPGLRNLSRRAVEEIAQRGVPRFLSRYLDCPAVIPRCMWGAKPYRGAATLLTLPLRYVYVHHTYHPSRPCATFPQCAANMRAMQRFHQEEREWDDIAY